MIATSLGQTFVGALVKIESPVSLSPAKFGTSSLLAVGDFVLSVGNTFSMGIISCLKRRQHDLRLEGKCEVYLQTDCCLHEGSSGGALVNLEGEVIGLNCGHGEAEVGVGFAIPIGTVLKVMKERRWLCEDRNERFLAK
ncbi:PREDICTED: putative protease Do-like 14 [Brassica oleracea var. oleracea]|uniref:Peptidase S1 domain-containing protein n=1 Tax=Brassica oleracea var. oleracea TaxID=109376 RepID=A0A0D3DY68_BRAOL|nr:PREDICTED: putative protease Do-like 14 [Brassica oleracea var. oleracea]